MHGLESILFMMKKLKEKEIEYLIMADEDVLFKNETLVFNIINQMKSEDYIVCGIRDGGHIVHRKCNPYVINTFFSIINFKEIELIWDEVSVLENNYIIENEFEDDLNKLIGLYDKNKIFEPYYCFYLWLRRKNKKFLFLSASMAFDDDEFTNVVYYKDEILLYHTWHARFYNKNKKHTERIDKILKLFNLKNHSVQSPVVFKDKTYLFRKLILRYYKRLVNNIEGFKK